jgi:hypothetical protein
MGRKADLLEELSQGTGIQCSVLEDRTNTTWLDGLRGTIRICMHVRSKTGIQEYNAANTNRPHLPGLATLGPMRNVLDRRWVAQNDTIW